MVVLFAQYLREHGPPEDYGRRVVFNAGRKMRRMQRDKPGEYFKFLAWAAAKKEGRKK